MPRFVTPCRDTQLHKNAQRQKLILFPPETLLSHLSDTQYNKFYFFAIKYVSIGANIFSVL